MGLRHTKCDAGAAVAHALLGTLGVRRKGVRKSANTARKVRAPD